MQKYKEIKIVKNLDKVREFVEDLIDKSNDSWCTKKYDDYQFKVNKIPKWFLKYYIAPTLSVMFIEKIA